MSVSPGESGQQEDQWLCSYPRSLNVTYKTSIKNILANFGFLMRSHLYNSLGFRGRKVLSESRQKQFSLNDFYSNSLSRGSIFWSRRYAERIWGELFILVRRISQRILIANFSALLFQGFRSPKNSRPKFTSRIVGIPLQFRFLEPKIYSRRFSAYGEDQNLVRLQALVTCSILL